MVSTHLFFLGTTSDCSALMCEKSVILDRIRQQSQDFFQKHFADEAGERRLCAYRNPCLKNPGFRGSPPRDRKAIVNLLLIVSEIIEAYPEIHELDLNPVLVYDEGLSIADARIILRAQE